MSQPLHLIVRNVACMEEKLMKVDNSYNMACHDWIIAGRQEKSLLDEARIALILQDILHLDISPQLMEYLLCSIAYIPAIDASLITKFTQWLNSLDPLRRDTLFESVLAHQSQQIRAGVSRLIEVIGDPNIAENLIAHLNREHDPHAKRAMLHCLHRLGKRLPDDVAHDLFRHDSDWVVQSYALSHLPKCTSCLLIADGTDFAADLGKMAQDAGFKFVTVSAPTTFDTITTLQHLDAEILKAYDLLILVKGEHYTRATEHDYYSQIHQFVSEGGNLFATSWVCWENASNGVLTDLLPFVHLHNTYHENVIITCCPTDHTFALQLFPEQITYVSSYELLQGKDDTAILFETDQHIPIFGFRHFGKGMCYYFNTCQHYCFGEMPSPFKTNAQLELSFQRVFQWIFDTLQHDAEANKSNLN
ncbi:hypothetical protein U27_06901 [Candidatus Vecturithrix granuli]|uniref:HEAT repeat domain-containing protein n=1 Tax=Vecturithrix granuli TaxID=1499967 RepID=A0A081C5R0_VECG1|nr:hypothetical protein U27_06901 [Candidatus Vecturithrix granuli]